jgi:hypothetical protein
MENAKKIMSRAEAVSTMQDALHGRLEGSGYEIETKIKAAEQVLRMHAIYDGDWSEEGILRAQAESHKLNTDNAKEALNYSRAQQLWVREHKAWSESAQFFHTRIVETNEQQAKALQGLADNLAALVEALNKKGV